MFSGEFESGDFIGQVYDALLPPFVGYLKNIPPKIRVPPNPEPYVGTFMGGGVKVVVFVQDNVLYGQSSNSTTMTMDYWDTNKMQVIKTVN